MGPRNLTESRKYGIIMSSEAEGRSSKLLSFVLLSPSPLGGELHHFLLFCSGGISPKFPKVEKMKERKFLPSFFIVPLTLEVWLQRTVLTERHIRSLAAAWHTYRHRHGQNEGNKQEK